MAEDELDRVRRVRREAEQAVTDWRAACVDLLRAPYVGMTGWALTTYCATAGHPSRRFDEDAPCCCWRKDNSTGTEHGWTTPPWEASDG